MQGPLAAYRAKLTTGILKTDPVQALAAERLQDLWRKLRGYDPPVTPHSRVGWLGRFLRVRKVDDAEDRAGLYLVGDVGRGKSMLMDIFFETADLPRKRRVHFHAFMQDAHKSIHRWRKTNPNSADPIPPLADSIAVEAALLCFDEFQINDIADALILGRLFQALFERGVVVVATSNTAPDDLFANQPGRDAFLPFIALLKANLDVLVLEAGPDYRRSRLEAESVWIVPADSTADNALDAVFRLRAKGAPVRDVKLTTMGRAFAVPRAAGCVARFDFETLCGGPFGAGDYLALAVHFSTLILDRIPQLTAEESDKAQRLIMLIDALYEHRVKLYASANALPDQLCTSGRVAESFKRTASRLLEMQSVLYAELPHLT